MRFGFSLEDDEIRDAVRSLLGVASPPSVVRDAWDAPSGKLDRALWSQLSELGVPAILLAEGDGGLGLDERTLVRVLEEVGYAGVPLPVVESTLVATTVLEPHRIGALVATDLGGPHVPMALDADVLVLRAPDGTLHMIDVDGATVAPSPSTDGARRLATVSWSPTNATLVCDDPDMIELAIARGTFGTAAVLIGLLQRMLDLTIGYVCERHQFGVPIGSFQAVKHHLADAHMAVAFARPAVHRAAWSIASNDPDRRTHVAMAKLLANEASNSVTRSALQCHGAIGYTVEYDLHLYMKRAWALRSTWGDSVEQRRTLARELGIAS